MPTLISLTYIAEIQQICLLACRPDLAMQFIAKHVPIANVRHVLLEARAKEDEALEINHTPPRGTTSAKKDWNDREEVQKINDRQQKEWREYWATR